MEIAELLQLSVEQGASDLHLLPGQLPTMRIHGDLVPMKDMPVLSPELTKRLIYSVMSEQQQAEFEQHLEMDMALTLPNIGHFRVNVLHQLHGVAAVCRVIAEQVPSFEELGLPQVLKSLLLLPHGLVLVTGPTGSGKSTTLASMVDYINGLRACHIITIEDPIEYIYQNKKSLINQRQINRDTSDVKTALKAALRQDPDVILLGEMRDLETMRLALTAAETGHLVLATLHASSAPLAISRIIDVFPDQEKNRIRNLLSESLKAVICQNLIKRISGGRVAAFEIMLANNAIKHQIRQDKIPHMLTTIQTSGDIGMCTMDQYLQDLVAKQVITLAAAKTASFSTEWF